METNIAKLEEGLPRPVRYYYELLRSIAENSLSENPVEDYRGLWNPESKEQARLLKLVYD